MTDPFEIWLRTVCFQKPTDPAYDLARDAWKAAIKHEREACAKVCTDIWHDLAEEDAGIEASVAVGDCAHLIRSRE